MRVEAKTGRGNGGGMGMGRYTLFSPNISLFCNIFLLSLPFFFDWEGYISWGRKWGRGRESESEVAQSCPTLCDSINISPPGSSVHGIFLARVLEWGAIVFSINVAGESIISLKCLTLGIELNYIACHLSSPRGMWP